MPRVLSSAALALIEQPVIGHLATIDERGRAHVTPIWIDHQGGDVVFNTAEGRVKTRHIRNNPNVGLSLVKPDDPYSAIALSGKVTEISTEGADDHIDALAKKYLGVDSYPMRREGEIRVKVRIEPVHIMMQPA